LKLLYAQQISLRCKTYCLYEIFKVYRSSRSTVYRNELLNKFLTLYCEQDTRWCLKGTNVTPQNTCRKLTLTFQAPLCVSQSITKLFTERNPSQESINICWSNR